MTSQRSTRSAVFGLLGLPNHGSSRIVLPPGVVTSQQEWPYQVMVVSRSSPTCAPPLVVASRRPVSSIVEAGGVLLGPRPHPPGGPPQGAPGNSPPQHPRGEGPPPPGRPGRSPAPPPCRRRP